MEKSDLIRNTVETIFNDLKIIYSNIDLEDEDLNYLIKFNTYGKLKSLKSISGVLYLHQPDFSMNLIVINIYNLGDENTNIDTLDIYEVVNDINSGLLCGSFLIRDNKSIYYRSSINCGMNYSELSKELLKRQLDIFTDGLGKLFDVLNDKEQSDE